MWHPWALIGVLTLSVPLSELIVTGFFGFTFFGDFRGLILPSFPLCCWIPDVIAQFSCFPFCSSFAWLSSFPSPLFPPFPFLRPPFFLLYIWTRTAWWWRLVILSPNNYFYFFLYTPWVAWGIVLNIKKFAVVCPVFSRGWLPSVHRCSSAHAHSFSSVQWGMWA